MFLEFQDVEWSGKKKQPKKSELPVFPYRKVIKEGDFLYNKILVLYIFFDCVFL